MVELVEHRAVWALDFRSEAARVFRGLGSSVTAIEHIGSTAVPGLLAKPVIDLAARAAAGVDPFALGPLLEGLGYVRHSNGPKNHGVYVRSSSGTRTHILHVFAAEAWEHCNQRLFRDALLRDPAARQRYAELKRSLSGLDDGRDYTAGKLDLVEEVLNAERARRGLGPTSAWDK
ncbi:GrpB family protein [Curtobacterium sp. ZW137]|uniref:GrpB family protein n=1 Tax=Curtobacterium sp. ZW137 TaxID=2485104 RepID=UPI000F4C698E|nr:GrpB family protein [Curtobacterium sp. ZW137]ROP65602.1 GrpB-like predicted nucleotidyltransferase (UPF0157 family) [Curtobacterium sp. ZW137]